MKTTTVALLRAVNVGGRVVTMQRLRELFEGLGLGGVRTYIQSGNVFFEAALGAAKQREALARKIEKALERALGYEVPVMLRTLAELEATVEAFAGEPPPAADVRHVVLFTSAPLPPEPPLPIHVEKHGMSLLYLNERDVFAVLRVGKRGMGNPAALVEKTFGVKATARFYHTTRKILDAARVAPDASAGRRQRRSS